MKRYGYKFRRLDGENTSAIDLRYFPVLGAFVGGVFTSLVFPPGLVHYIVFVVHIINGFLAEALPKVGIALAIAIFIASFGYAALIYYPEINQCYAYCSPSNWQRRQGYEPQILSLSQFLSFMGAFLLYHSLYLKAAFRLLRI